MLLFSNPGCSNTAAAAHEAIRKAKQLKTDVVFASSTGKTARAVIDEAQKQDYPGKLICVRSVSDAKNHGQNRMPTQIQKELLDHGVVIVTAAHALSGGERGLSSQPGGIYPLEIMAATLRTFGQGAKVCFECAVMALDADVIEWGKAIVALAGTSEGADTAMVLTPGYSASILSTRIHEILCKPALMQAE